MAAFIEDLLNRLTGGDETEEVDLEEIDSLSEGGAGGQDINLEENVTAPNGSMENGEQTQTQQPQQPTQQPQQAQQPQQVQQPQQTAQIDDSVLEEFEEELEDLEEDIEKSLAKTEKAENRIDEFEEKISKLYMIYEAVFKGVNPFEEDYDFSENAHGVLEDFMSGGGIEGEGGAPLSEEEKEKMNELENRVDELEEKIEEGEIPMPEEFEEEEEEIEEEYEEAFEGEKPEARWEPGDPVKGPEGEDLIITEKEWDTEEEKWKYKCKPMGGA